jgi:transposase
VRLRLVKHARAHGIRDAVRAFATSRNTVRRWLRRYEVEGPKGLRDRSRAPHRCPHKTSPHHERKVLEARERMPAFGPRRLKDLMGVKPSLGAVARILRQHGRTRKPRTKTEKKNDLRAVKMRYRAFQRIQADTKTLLDIPYYWSQMRALGLPQRQYTHRDVKSGALFVDYADELSTTYARMATERLVEHLERYGVDPARITLTSDNGSEYGGAERRERSHGYHAQIEALGVRHRFLPPATPNAHADVESSHRSIEDEFYDLETFRSRRDFFEKAATYQLWWNFARPNYSKGRRTPAQILEEEGIDPRVLILTPADLDLHMRRSEIHPRVGPHVPVDSVWRRG